VYRDPYDDAPTGYGRADIGTTIAVRLDTSTPSFYQAARIRGGNGDDWYRDNFLTCSSERYVFAPEGAGECDDEAEPEETPWCIEEEPGSGSVPQATKELEALILQDSGASAVVTVDGDGNPSVDIVGSCAPNGCTCGACANGKFGRISPRIVILALINPNGIVEGHNYHKIVNLFTFFMMPPGSDGTINAVLVSTDGLLIDTGGGGDLNPDFAFLQTPLLVW
jgi:hypothetical protein